MSKKKQKPKSKRIWRILMYAAFALLLVFLIPELLVKLHASDRIFDTAEDVPKNRVCLLLGTSKSSSLGPNPYFHNRIDATANLYKAGKVERILVTGDNGTKRYNEPTDMRDALIKKGVPKDDIVLDFAGFRTLDSVVRSKEVFGQDRITIVSQRFHNERALYIAKWKGIDAVAYNAADVTSKRAWKVLLRERFARVKMFIDLIIGTEPKFLGKKEPI